MHALLEDFYGSGTGPLNATGFTPAAVATLVLTFSDGNATTSRRSLVLTLANAYIEEYSCPKNPGETLVENASGFCKSLTSAVYIDNTATAP